VGRKSLSAQQQITVEAVHESCVRIGFHDVRTLLSAALASSLEHHGVIRADGTPVRATDVIDSLLLEESSASSQKARLTSGEHQLPQSELLWAEREHASIFKSFQRYASGAAYIRSVAMRQMIGLLLRTPMPVLPPDGLSRAGWAAPGESSLSQKQVSDGQPTSFLLYSMQGSFSLTCGYDQRHWDRM